MSKYLIIGGVAGGATAAARLRRLDEHAEIVVFERGGYISYANCGLPYYIGNVIPERENLLLQTPESFKERLNVEVRVYNEVLSIGRKNKKIEVRNVKTGEVYFEDYDKLILSPGAEPVKPPIPGINNPLVFTLRNVHDTDKIKEFLLKNTPQKAVVVGGGFIGLEMAENLHHLGMTVSIVEMAGQVMAPLDYEMAAEVHQHLKNRNIELYLRDGVACFENENGNVQITLQSGRKIKAGLVILSIGVKPENKLARQAGLELAPNGGIVANEYLLSSDENIYVLGDAMAFPHPITGKPVNTYLAGPANKQARIVADNIVNGNTRKYKGSLATAIAKVFDLTVATTGIPEKTLKSEKIPYKANIIHGIAHAGYYPDALPYALKLLFHPEHGKLYGAQIIGYDGIDKRIDLIASILKQEGTIYDLQEIEHAYAPPYSSAKDPVNQAGFAAENIIAEKLRTISWDEVEGYSADNKALLLDVRTKEEHALGHIEGSINIAVDDLRQRINELPKDKKIIVYCAAGLRGYIACRILSQSGFHDVYNLSGGYKTYSCAIGKQSNEGSVEPISIKKNNKKEPESAMSEQEIKTIKVNACGLQCPGPILKLKQEIEAIEEGQRLEQTATDMGFMKDVESWCNMTGNKLISVSLEMGKVKALIEKTAKPAAIVQDEAVPGTVRNKTMVVFSDDMDRALASLVIANGAAATGSKVTMFFTFWGLNVIKKSKKPKIKKDFMGKMFGSMMANDAGDLKLSKMNMMGIGAIMMKKRMQAKKVDSLEEMLQTALDNGVEMIACQMSMDVMGVDAKELIEGVEIGGVATYLEEAEQSSVNLFI